MKRSQFFYTFICILSLALPLHGMNHGHQHDEFNEDTDTHSERRGIIIRSIANTLCASAIDGTFGYCGVINHDTSPCLSAAISTSAATLLDNGLTDLELIPKKPTAPFFSTQGACNALIQMGANTMTKTAIKQCLAALNTNTNATNSAPVNAATTVSPQSIALGAAPLVIGIISGQLTDKAYCLLMAKLNKSYTKKENCLAKREGTYTLPAIKAETRHWDAPYWEPTPTEGITLTRGPTEVLNKKDASKPQKLFCKLYQENSAIIVQENVINNNVTWYLVTSKYESSSTSWNYLLPFGMRRFRPAMMALKKAILDNHITVAGPGIKLDKILEPEPLTAAQLRKAIEEHNHSFE
jgi:hypothetical protein